MVRLAALKVLWAEEDARREAEQRRLAWEKHKPDERTLAILRHKGPPSEALGFTPSPGCEALWNRITAAYTRDVSQGFGALEEARLQAGREAAAAFDVQYPQPSYPARQPRPDDGKAASRGRVRKLDRTVREQAAVIAQQAARLAQQDAHIAELAAAVVALEGRVSRD